MLQREIRHRKKTGGGASPLADLPRLTGLDEIAASELPALSARRRAKRDPSEYVALKEQGLTNTEIGSRLGVSEASVRRWLTAAGPELPARLGRIRTRSSATPGGAHPKRRSPSE